MRRNKASRSHLTINVIFGFQDLRHCRTKEFSRQFVKEYPLNLVIKIDRCSRSLIEVATRDKRRFCLFDCQFVHNSLMGFFTITFFNLLNILVKTFAKDNITRSKGPLTLLINGVGFKRAENRSSRNDGRENIILPRHCHNLDRLHFFNVNSILNGVAEFILLCFL